MLQRALACDVRAFLAAHADRADERGRKQVVRTGYLPARSIMTGAGPLDVEQPRVRAVQARSASQPPPSRRRRLNAHRQIALVLEGRIFSDGVLQKAA